MATASDGPLPVERAVEACRAPGSFVWIGLYEPTGREFEEIQREFELHPVAVEDAIHAHQRPKLEVFGTWCSSSSRPPATWTLEEVVQFGEILIFLGHDYVITVRHGEASELGDVRRRLEREPELLSHGPGAVLHSIVDKVVDDYGPAIGGLGQDIEEVEVEVFSGRRSNPAERIYKLKREVLEFTRAAGPLVGPVDLLAREASS